MPGPAATAAERAPRRARYLIPLDTPRRGEIVAVLAVALLLAHLLLAQLTIVLAVVLAAVGRVSRWRPQWLAVPAGAGLIWVLAIGPAAAWAGFTAGPRQVLAYLSGIAGHPGRLLHLSTAFAGLGQWLPRQLPLALILAAAEAAVVAWLSWLHTCSEAVRPPRPGLVAATRRRYAAAAIRSGGVVTADGGALGVDQAAGGRAAISWRAAEGGVLAVGAAGAGWPGSRSPGPAPFGPASSGSGSSGPGSARLDAPGPRRPGPGPAATSFQLVHAAIRRRKPVIIVDLTGSPWLAGSVAAVCQAAGAPLGQFGAAGPASYEPLRGGDPARAAALVTGMLDWTAVTDHHRRACAAYLGDVLAVLALAPGDSREPVLDDIRRLLSPAALQARLRQVPAHYPQRSSLAERVAASAGLIEADRAALPALAAALTALQDSPLGRWLRPGSERISLGQVVRERAVGLFALDRAVHGQAATMIARLVAGDALALFAELRGIPVSGDGLVWFNGCEAVDPAVLAELVASGGRAGMTVLLSTMSEAAAVSLAAGVNVLAIHQLADPAAARQLAALTGAGPAGGGQAPADAAGPLAPGIAVPGAAALGAAPPFVPPGTPGAVPLVPLAYPGSVPLGLPATPAAVPLVPLAYPGSVPLVPPGTPGVVPVLESGVPGAASSAAAPGAAVPQAPSAVPDWARRMPAPAAAGSAGAGAVSSSAGPAADHPFLRKGSPVVTADSLLGLSEGAFTLVVKGPERRILPRCQAVAARIPGWPA
jgi:hypothetical protein